MALSRKPITTIGSKELVNFPELGLERVPAKVDTGADSSAIWATKIKESEDGLQFILFDRHSPFYTGEVLTTHDFSVTSIRNSFGQTEVRYKVKLKVTIAGRTVQGNFTLADRSQNRFPVLLGRRTLHAKFLVDVSRRRPKAYIEVLFLVRRPDAARSRRFAAGIQTLNPRLHTFFATYDELDFMLNEQGSKVVLTPSGRDLASFDLLYFKAISQQAPYLDVAATIAQYLRKRGINVIDEVVADFPKTSKLYQYLLLNDNNVPTPPSLYVARSKLGGSFAHFSDVLGLPFVLKDMNSNNGRNNYLISDEVTFHQACDEITRKELNVIAQQFVSNDGDYRVLVMGRKVALVIHRHRTDDTTHLNSTSQGGKATLVPVGDLPGEVRAQCLMATTLLKRDIAGVDMVQDKHTGLWYCLEVNDGPQLASGAFVAEKQAALAQYIDKEFRR